MNTLPWVICKAGQHPVPSKSCHLSQCTHTFKYSFTASVVTSAVNVCFPNVFHKRPTKKVNTRIYNRGHNIYNPSLRRLLSIVSVRTCGLTLSSSTVITTTKRSKFTRQKDGIGQLQYIEASYTNTVSHMSDIAEIHGSYCLSLLVDAEQPKCIEF